MELIKRPEKNKNDIQKMSEQNMQENFEEQFKNIYDYLDKMAIRLNNVYSDTPVEIGDGIYAVWIDLGTVEVDKSYSKDLSYLGIDEVLSLEGRLTSSLFKHVAINFINADLYNYAFISSDNKIYYRTHWAGNVKVLLKYTKK